MRECVYFSKWVTAAIASSEKAHLDLPDLTEMSIMKNDHVRPDLPPKNTAVAHPGFPRVRVPIPKSGGC